MKKIKKHPDRLTVWLTREDAWLHTALETLAGTLTHSRGIRTSKSDLVRHALLAQYGHLKPTTTESDENTDDENGSDKSDPA